MGMVLKHRAKNISANLHAIIATPWGKERKCGVGSPEFIRLSTNSGRGLSPSQSLNGPCRHLVQEPAGVFNAVLCIENEGDFPNHGAMLTANSTGFLLDCLQSRCFRKLAPRHGRLRRQVSEAPLLGNRTDD